MYEGSLHTGAGSAEADGYKGDCIALASEREAEGREVGASDVEDSRGGSGKVSPVEIAGRKWWKIQYGRRGHFEFRSLDVVRDTEKFLVYRFLGKEYRESKISNWARWFPTQAEALADEIERRERGVEDLRVRLVSEGLNVAALKGMEVEG